MFSLGPNNLLHPSPMLPAHPAFWMLVLSLKQLIRSQSKGDQYAILGKTGTDLYYAYMTTSTTMTIYNIKTTMTIYRYIVLYRDTRQEMNIDVENPPIAYVDVVPTETTMTKLQFRW